MLLYNHATEGDPAARPTSCVVKLTLDGLAGGKHATAASVRRIDATHANAYTEWVKLGMPQDLLPPTQVAQLKAASSLVVQQVTLGADGSVTVAVPLHGVAAVRLQL